MHFEERYNQRKEQWAKLPLKVSHALLYGRSATSTYFKQKSTPYEIAPNAAVVPSRCGCTKGEVAPVYGLWESTFGIISLQSQHCPSATPKTLASSSIQIPSAVANIFLY